MQPNTSPTTPVLDHEQPWEILSDGRSFTIHPETLEVVELRASSTPTVPTLFRSLVRLPNDIVPSEFPDTLAALAADIERLGSVSSDTALLLAMFVAATWVVDRLPVHPVIHLSGDCGSLSQLTECLGLCCRRTVPVGRYRHNLLLSLPVELHPTLIIRAGEGWRRDLIDLVSGATGEIWDGDRVVKCKSGSILCTPNNLEGTVPIDCSGTTSTYYGQLRRQSGPLASDPSTPACVLPSATPSFCWTFFL